MYSNCLIEALKAKIKDPKNVHIIYLPKKWNMGINHYMWVKDGMVYHYTHDKVNTKQQYLFKGYVKKQSMEAFEAFILRQNRFCFEKDRIKFAKKLRFPSINKPGYLEWERYLPGDGMNNFPEKNRICKYVYVTDSNTIMKVVEIESLKKEDIKDMDWKYFSPYDENYGTSKLNHYCDL